MTPFDASVPYNVAAAGPFAISTLPMSSGLKSLNREIELEPKSWLVGPEAKFASTRIPSTYTSGWLESEKLDAPRMRMRDPDPTAPVAGWIRTPAARPFNRLWTSLMGVACVTLAASMCETALPSARDRKSTRLNSSHGYISYAVFCLKKKKKTK